jgi:hypothetical protein
MRGLRNLDNGDEPIRDDAARRALRARAVRIWLAAIALTGAAGALLSWIPR